MSIISDRDFDEEHKKLIDKAQELYLQLKTFKDNFHAELTDLTEPTLKYVFEGQHLAELTQDIVALIDDQNTENKKFIILDNIEKFIKHVKDLLPQLSHELNIKTLKNDINDLGSFMSQHYNDELNLF